MNMTRLSSLAVVTLAVALPSRIQAQSLAPSGNLSKADTTKKYVTLFADGNIRGVATAGSKESTTGTGSLGIALSSPKITVSAQVTVLSTVDTLRNEVGATILSPLSGKSFQSGLLDLRVRNVFKKLHLGLHGYLGASKSVWAQDTAARASVLGTGGLTAFWSEEGKVSDNPVGLLIEAGVALRRIGGDIGSAKSLRESMLGTSERTFPGLEGGVQISFNSITAGIGVYWFSGKGVNGLTGGQLAAGMTVRGDIFAGTLTK